MLVLCAAALPAPAFAQDFQTIFQDYKDNGRLDSCYKAYQLHNAKQSIPPDIEQYAPGFGDAVSAGQAACSRGAPPPAEEEVVPPSAGTPGPGTPPAATKKAVKKPPAPKKQEKPVLAALPAPDLATPASSGVTSETPGGLIVLLAAAGIALAIALAWAIAWFMGWSPERFTRPLGAAFGSVFSRR